MAQSLPDVLGLVRGGYALHDASKKLAEVIQAVKATGKPGEVTLTIKISPDKTDDRIFTLKPSVKCKVPEKGYAEGHVFLDSVTGKITKEDPAQMELLAERRENGVANHEEGISRVGRGGS